ncbi:hypothetical protein ACJX0J_007142, partial [Zea mays]
GHGWACMPRMGTWMWHANARKLFNKLSSRDLLRPEDIGVLALVSNLYAAAKKWDKDSGSKKIERLFSLNLYFMRRMQKITLNEKKAYTTIVLMFFLFLFLTDLVY